MTISLRSLLERDHRLIHTFRSVTGEEPKAYRASVTATKGRHDTQISLGRPRSSDDWRPTLLELYVVGHPSRLNAKMAERAFGDVRGLISTGGPSYKFVPDVHLQWAASLGSERLLPMIVGDDSDIYVAETFDNGDRVALVHRTYLLAFILGMLSRYHPAVWMSLQQNLKGSAPQPLLRAALQAVEEDFPALLGSYLGSLASAGT